MANSLFLILLLTFLAAAPVKESGQVGVTLCGMQGVEEDLPSYPDTSAMYHLKGVPVSVASISGCDKVTLVLDENTPKKYKDAVIVAFTFIHSPPKGGAPPFFEIYKGSHLSAQTKNQLLSAKAGDLIIITDVKISINGGKKIMNERGIIYSLTE